MVLKHFTTDALEGLCTEDQLDLLNSVDTLRSQGISHYISLPQIIVCGDQSSGKSSVLEAISGVSFPVKSNLCTRFPTELVLRKCPQIGVSVSIVPHGSRSESEQHSLESFRETLDSFEGFPALVERAKAAMGISTHGKAFSKDLLRVEVSGPDRPHLTIVDLPGLIHSETKKQSASDVRLVQDVVRTYMKEPRSIILAVMSAKNDIANQVVLKLAREADPSGHRTLGIITKPDTLVVGSDSESTFVSLAKNQEVEFRLGWHTLKNMDSEKGLSSLADRDSEEREFFSQGIWEDMPRSILGIDKLRGRLSKVLLGQIAAELPSLIDEINAQVDTARRDLEKLGEPRASLRDQKSYLLHISQSYQSLVKAAVDGTYNEPFFEETNANMGYQKRIRAVVQNLNQDFSNKISQNGNYRQIMEDSSTECPTEHQVYTTHEGFVRHIESLLKTSKGRELPGTFNPMVVKDLFFEQSAPWEKLCREHITKVWEAVKEFLHLAITHIADATTTKRILQAVVEPSLNELLKILNNKTSELLAPHRKGHPITYNHYFTETYQKIRNERQKADYAKILKNFFGISSLDTAYEDLNSEHSLHRLLNSLVERTEPDMRLFAASEALDYMMAYYRVALKRFIDDVAIEIIETKLVSALDAIFSPITVFNMPDDIVTRIAGESEEHRAEREELNKQLDILTKGASTCKQFIGNRGLLNDNEPSPGPQPILVTDVDHPSERRVATVQPLEDNVECLTDRSDCRIMSESGSICSESD